MGEKGQNNEGFGFLKERLMAILPHPIWNWIMDYMEEFLPGLLARRGLTRAGM